LGRVIGYVMRMDVSDEILALSATNGDGAAFSTLLERHYDGLFRLAFRLTGARAEAEDLTQDICAALPAKLARFRGEARFTTWLWRVAVNAAHDRRRRARTQARHADGWGGWELNRRATNDEAAYAGSAGQVLAPTLATDQAAILGALDNLSAGGSTAGQQGLRQAYAVAEGMAEAGEVTRVILATDGDFNVGLSDPDRLKTFIAAKRGSGTYLSVMGFGRGNLDDATMQALAQNGNGQAAYIDTLSEAQKVLVDQFTGALFPIANDVKIQVEFNPATVSEYRLIGYETRILRREDFNNDKVDAGDIGAGHSLTALYEVTPVGSPAQLADPLRYQPGQVTATGDELGFLKLRYKEPGETSSQLIEVPIREGGVTSADMRFAAAIAGFGQLLQNSPYLGDWGYDQAITLANNTKGEDAFGYRAEAVRLMRLAQSLSR